MSEADDASTWSDIADRYDDLIKGPDPPSRPEVHEHDLLAVAARQCADVGGDTWRPYRKRVDLARGRAVDQAATRGGVAAGEDVLRDVEVGEQRRVLGIGATPPILPTIRPL